jgi:hypothetical protein
MADKKSDEFAHLTSGLGKLEDLIHEYRAEGEEHINDEGSSARGSSFSSRPNWKQVHTGEYFGPGEGPELQTSSNASTTRMAFVPNNIRGGQFALPSITTSPSVVNSISSVRGTALPAAGGAGLPQSPFALGSPKRTGFSMLSGGNLASENAIASSAQHINSESMSSHASNGSSALNNISGIGRLAGGTNAMGQIMLSLQKIIDILSDMNNKLDNLPGGKGLEVEKSPEKQLKPDKSGGLGVSGVIAALVTSLLATMGSEVSGRIASFGQQLMKDVKVDLSKISTEIENELNPSKFIKNIPKGAKNLLGVGEHDLSEIGNIAKRVLPSFKGAAGRTMAILGHVAGFADAGKNIYQGIEHARRGEWKAAGHNAIEGVGNFGMYRAGFDKNSLRGGGKIGALQLAKDSAYAAEILHDPKKSQEEKTKELESLGIHDAKWQVLNATLTAGAKMFGKSVVGQAAKRGIVSGAERIGLGGVAEGVLGAAGSEVVLPLLGAAAVNKVVGPQIKDHPTEYAAYGMANRGIGAVGGAYYDSKSFNGLIT